MYCGDCGKPLTEIASPKEEEVKTLDAKALDELEMLCPPDHEMAHDSVLAPEGPDSACGVCATYDAVNTTTDRPVHLAVPETKSGKIVITSVTGPEEEYHATVTEGDEIIIGTLPDAEYRVTGDPFVSRKHCVLQRTDGQIILKDNGSSNGTYLRVEKATSIPNGSVILVGKHLLRIEWE